MPASLQLLHSRPPPVTLVLYAPSADLARLLEARLPVGMRVQWQDSAAPPGALDVHRRSGRCLVLLDYRHASATVSSALTQRLQRSHPSLPLVAVGSTSAQQDGGIVAAVRAGLRDILDLDASTAEIDAVLRRAAAAPSPFPAAIDEIASRARLILLLGVRGGVGSSTLAAHLAVLAHRGTPLVGGAPLDEVTAPTNATLLVDLGQPAGDGALYLNLDSRFHYDDALRHANRIDATLAGKIMTHHEGGLTLLGRAADDDSASIADPAVLMQRLRGLFDTVLCDLGGLSVRQIPCSLLNSADEIWLIADQAIGTLVSLDSALKHLDALGARDRRVQLVVNRHKEGAGLSPNHIAARFSLPLLATLPDCPRLRASANHGHLLAQDAPRDPYLRALSPLLQRLGATCPTQSHGWRHRWASALGGLSWNAR